MLEVEEQNNETKKGEPIVPDKVREYLPRENDVRLSK